MNWQTEIRQAALTSPSGIRQVFTYENVSYQFDRKTTGFNFPDADGTFVQDLGRTGRRYPFRIFFHGDDYKTESELFESLLEEKGIFKLEHPMYGIVNVVPFGTISRRDDLKTAANQAIFTLTFWETIEEIIPLSQDDPTADVFVSLNGYSEEAAKSFELNMDLENVTEQVTTINKFKALINSVKAGLQKVADTIEAVQKQFDAIFDSINSSLDLLIKTPLALAQQCILLIQSPARAATNIQARLDGYKNLADSTIKQASGVFNIYAPLLGSENSNAFHSDELFAMSYTSGSVLSVVNNTFETAGDAIAAADFILTQFDELVEWRDDNYESLGIIDTGESYQKLQESVTLTIGFLIQISFTLKQERSVVLDRNRTIIDLCAELYGSVDDRLDFMINSNNLAGFPGILELQQGTTILYYV